MRYAKRDKVVARRIAGEMLLVPIRGNLADMEKVFVLEGTGEKVWDMLNGERGTRDIAKSLSDEFDVDTETAVADVESLMSDLEEAGLVEKVS